MKPLTYLLKYRILERTADLDQPIKVLISKWKTKNMLHWGRVMHMFLQEKKKCGIHPN